MAAKPKAKHWVGFDLGGTKMLAIVVDPDFEIIAKVRKKTRSYQGQEAGLQRITAAVQEALSISGIDPEQVAGIGVGSPGPLDPDRGVILDPPNLGWINAPLKKSLEKGLGRPVVITGDVDAGVYGELCFGAAKGAANALGVSPGTGIGGGYVLDGEIVQGRGCSAFEIGHLQVLPDGPLCGCGSRGCLEAVASRLAISSAAAVAAYRGAAPHLLSSVGMDVAEIRSGVLAASVAAGDRAVEEIVRQAARWIGIAVGSVVNLLVPEVVVLGGGLVEAMPQLFLEEVTDQAKTKAMRTYKDKFRVVVAEMGDYSTALGAAAWAQKKLGQAGPSNSCRRLLTAANRPDTGSAHATE